MNSQRKFFLFKQSKNFCAVPWNHLELYCDGSIKTCCKATQSFGNVNVDTLDQILKNKAILKIKKDLVNETYNDNCQDCHDLSVDNEHFDLRNHYNPMFKSTDIDYDDLQQFELNGIDLHWDNTCNFKCVYCGPNQSSLIAQEQGIKTDRIDMKNIDQIIQLILQNQYKIKEIYLSGGEPLLVKHNARLLSLISNTALPIRINSNISQAHDDNVIFQTLKKFSNVLWTVSAESFESKFNYTRSNGDWKIFLNNLENIKSLGHQIRVNSVFFVGSALDLFDVIEYFILKHNINDITINRIKEHPYLHVRNCPASVKENSKNKLHKLLGSGLILPDSNLYYNIARCEKELDQETNDIDGYKTYFESLDQKRNTNWREIFPELVR